MTCILCIFFSSSHNRHFLTKGEQRDKVKRWLIFLVCVQVARNQSYVARQNVKSSRPKSQYPCYHLPRLSLLIEDYRARYIAHLQGQLWAPDIYIACFVIVAQRTKHILFISQKSTLFLRALHLIKFGRPKSSLHFVYVLYIFLQPPVVVGYNEVIITSCCCCCCYKLFQVLSRAIITEKK